MSFDNMIWKVKQFFRKSLPLVIAVGVLFGGYKLYKRGYLHRYMPTSVTRLLYKIPYFGSRFHHYENSSGKSYSHSYAYGKRSKRRHARKHRRHRRH